MITMQALSQVVIQHIITKIFGKPRSAISTFFKGTQIEVRTSWSDDDLKIDIKKIKGRVSGDRTPPKKQIWTPGRGGESGVVVKPKRIVSAKG